MSKGKAYQDFLKSKFDIGQLFDKPEPLAGVRILEVCYVVLGPAACDYLGEFGAEVIKFEGQKGDQMRFVTPYAYFWKNMSPGLEIENHNKYWVGMHLGHPQGKELFQELVKKSDVVADNLTPGRMAEWGLSYKELKQINPGIIQLHVSGYGSWGPWTGRTSYDAVAQSMGALSPITGFEDRGPIKSGVWIADWITGLSCCGGHHGGPELPGAVRRRPVHRLHAGGKRHPLARLDLALHLQDQRGPEALRQSGPGHLSLRPVRMQGRLGGPGGLQQARVQGAVRGHGPDGDL